MRTFALVPAAGHSRRMGRPKLSLPLGDSTVIACVAKALKEGGVDDVLVVIGPHVADLGPLARTAGASVLLLDAETADMRGTVEAGLHWLAEHRKPAPQDSWLLCPADHPALEPEVVRTLIRGRLERPECSILIPVWKEKRGHPTLVAWHHEAPIRAWPRHLGLNSYFRSQEDSTRLVPVDSERILWDLDTVEDYQRLRDQA